MKNRICNVVYIIMLAASLCMVVSGAALGASGRDTDAKKPPQITEKGFLIIYGGDNWHYTDIDPQSSRGDYQTLGFAGHFGADLSRVFPDLRHIPGVLSFYFEPTYEQALTSGYEVALAFGFQYRLPVTESFDAFVSFSGAPAYVSSLQSQSPAGTGFTTEETLSLGGYYHLRQDEAVLASIRLKHNSNGRTDWPINIYNDWYCALGYSVFLN